MMITDTLFDSRDKGGIFYNIGSYFCVTFDTFIFLFCQGSHFIQNAVLNGDLSNIMKQCHIIQILQFFHCPSKSPCNLSGIQCHPEGMSLTVTVFQVYCVGDGDHSLKRKITYLFLLLFDLRFQFFAVIMKFYQMIHPEFQNFRHKGHADIISRPFL